MRILVPRKKNSVQEKTLATGDRQTRTIPTKDLPHQVVFGGGGLVCELSEPKKKANKIICTTHNFALAMLIVDSVGVVRGNILSIGSSGRLPQLLRGSTLLGRAKVSHKRVFALLTPEICN